MALLKNALYGIPLSLLASCGLFTSVPPKVLEGQRVAHQGITVIEDNILSILDAYEQDCKAAVTYHVMFIYEQKIEEARNDQCSTEHEIGVLISEITSERDTELKQAFLKIETRKQKMLDSITKNTTATKKLVEAVYDYLSATPITVDNADFWIVKIVEESHGRK